MTVALGFIHPNMVATGFMESVLGVVALKQIDAVYTERGGPAEIGQARDRLVHKFLQGDCEWLWFVDTDIIFKPGALGKLLSHGKEVVSANYSLVHEVPATWDWETRECAYRWNSGWSNPWGGMRHFKGNGLQRVGACGAGCLLINRSVLDKVGEPWFQELEGRGEDISFFTRLAEEGVPVYYDFSLKVLHQKVVWV